MKVLPLIIGILIIIACVISLLLAVLNGYAYYSLLDGSNEHYRRLRKKMIAFSISGVILALVGAICVIIYLKIN